ICIEEILHQERFQYAADRFALASSSVRVVVAVRMHGYIHTRIYIGDSVKQYDTGTSILDIVGIDVSISKVSQGLLNKALPRISPKPPVNVVCYKRVTIPILVHPSEAVVYAPGFAFLRI